MTKLKRTSVYPLYKDEAKLVPFAGWEMPVQFSGIKAEHEAVRTRAGLSMSLTWERWRWWGLMPWISCRN